MGINGRPVTTKYLFDPALLIVACRSVLEQDTEPPDAAWALHCSALLLNN